MAKLEPRSRALSEMPALYGAFIDRSRRFVESKGLSWNISVDADGMVADEVDWDLRVLTGSHARAASRMNGFAVENTVRECAIAAGWPIALLPIGAVLSDEVQDFLKAVVAHRCKEAVLPRTVRHEARVYRKFFSVTIKSPWDLSTDDFNRFMQLGHQDAKVEVTVSGLAKLMNEKLLSLHVPLGLAGRTEALTDIQTAFDDRKHAERLPDVDALYELTRIVFQAKPVGHHDRLRFCVVRLLLFTGLRLNEILMLPSDCLRWEAHLDVVTGLPAGEVGGTSRTLQLRYFGEKREEGRPDLLVEDHQWIPERFHQVVADSVEVVLKATAPLREALNRDFKDARRFKTSAGLELTVADLLFLVIPGAKGELPSVIPADAFIETLGLASFYEFMGVTRRERRMTVFMKYGEAPNCAAMSIEPHSLRHLMNTEFFRLNIPDTIITQHFGRESVPQSYEYDHRSLNERLSFVQLPPSAAEVIEPGTAQETVAKMVVGGFASGSHIAKSFKKIQAEHGDRAAFEYLVTNSDGFHVTPYGFCTTSFAVNPCVRHLKCFHDCKHYVASGIPEHRVTLEELRLKLVSMRKKAAAKPVTSIGRKNQIEHADHLIAGVDAALVAQPGAVVFENGRDHSALEQDLFA
jgi:hypothetical protein